LLRVRANAPLTPLWRLHVSLAECLGGDGGMLLQCGKGAGHDDLSNGKNRREKSSIVPKNPYPLNSLKKNMIQHGRGPNRQQSVVQKRNHM
jgi:hypothetical protein